MTSATDAAASSSQPPQQPPQGRNAGAGGDDGHKGVVGGAIKEGEGGIKQALAEGKGWSEHDILAYAKTIGDNHPMFAESLEVSGWVWFGLVGCVVDGFRAGGLDGGMCMCVRGCGETERLHSTSTVCTYHTSTRQEMDPAMIEAIQAIKFEGKNFR